jgi:hypothetical protein
VLGHISAFLIFGLAKSNIYRYIDNVKRRTAMSKLVTHQHIWKPSWIPGGVTGATLCGRKSGIRESEADLNVGENVTCKLCLAILKSDRPHYAKRFLGMSSYEVEVISQSRMR